MPRVKPLGTQPDQRNLEIRAAIHGGLERKGMNDQRDFAKLLRVCDKTAKKFLGHPEDLKVRDLQFLVDTLNIPEEEVIRFFYKERRGKK